MRWRVYRTDNGYAWVSQQYRTPNRFWLHQTWTEAMRTVLADTHPPTPVAKQPPPPPWEGAH